MDRSPMNPHGQLLTEEFLSILGRMPADGETGPKAAQQRRCVACRLVAHGSGRLAQRLFNAQYVDQPAAPRSFAKGAASRIAVIGCSGKFRI